MWHACFAGVGAGSCGDEGREVKFAGALVSDAKLMWEGVPYLPCVISADIRRFEVVGTLLTLVLLSRHATVIKDDLYW
jgi:hypothetical protein